MTPISLPAVDLSPDASKGLAKRSGAARDFEALLIGQMLQSVREQGSGWLGGGEDDATSTAFGLGEQHLAAAISAVGGLGLGRMIERSLARSAANDGTALPASDTLQGPSVTAPGLAPPSLVRQR